MSARLYSGRLTRSRVVVLGVGALIAAQGGFPLAAEASSLRHVDVGGGVNTFTFSPAGDRVYAPVGQDLVVVDAANRSVVGTVPLPGSALDVANDPVSGRALLAMNTAAIGIVDPATMTFAGSIPVANPPSTPNLTVGVVRLTTSAAMSRAYAIAALRRSGPFSPGYYLISVSLTGGPTDQVSALLGTNQPSGIVVDDASGHVYVAEVAGNHHPSIAVFDAATLASTGLIDLTSNQSNQPKLAFDAVNHRLYAGMQTADAPLAIIDTTSDTVIGTLPVSDTTTIAFDPARDRLLVEQPFTLRIFEGGVQTETVPFNQQVYVVGVDPVTGNPWVNDASQSGLWMVDLAPDARPRSGLVTRVGSDLFVDGNPYTFTGVNLYNANSDGWCREAIDDATLESSLDSLFLNNSGHGVVRAWFFQTLATSDPSGVRDWSRFDRLLRLAAERGLKVIPTLADQWGECGARVAPTYSFKTEAWYTDGYKAPDPALAAAHGGSWLSYRDWVAEVVARYKDDTTVAFWQLMNEAEVNPGGAFGVCPPGDGPRDELMSFASDVSDLVKSIDPDHLLSLGTIGGGQCGTSGPQYKDVHALPNIDLCEYHDYTPNQAIPGDQWNGLGLRIQQCAELDKPLFVGEMGIRPIDVGGSLEDRAVALREKIDVQKARGVKGFVAWDYTPGASTLDNYDIGPGDPAVSALEPANWREAIVVNTSDDVDDGFCTVSHCSLREALNRSNLAAPTKSVIRFDIPGPAPHVIKPTSPLPVIVTAVLIDGTAQPDFTAAAPTIVISGVDGPVADGLAVNSFHSAIRGLVINGFGKAAIRMGGGNGLITGNRIGTSVDGSAAVRHPGGRADVGILITNDWAQVGGLTGGDPNLISGNDDGIVVGGEESRIIGNLIGTDASGNPGAGNAGAGIRITAALRIEVGGTDPGEGNVIAGSGGDGVAIVDDFSVGNVVSGNSIHDSGDQGIDIADDGADLSLPVENTATGPNRYQGWPTIQDVTGVTATGRVGGLAGEIHIEFFISPSCDSSGHGEGARFVGSTTVTATGLPPSALFSYDLPQPLAGDEVLTATATTSDGTSEFSPCWPAPPGPIGNTPIGTDVVTAPVDPVTGTAPAVVVFDNVTSPGQTSLSTSDTAPALPAGFVAGDPPTYFDLSTTATFDGQVNVCISFAGIAYIDPAAIRLNHYESGPGTWADVTTSVDTDAELVCGSVTSLSPFALVQPAPRITTAAVATFTAGTAGSFDVHTSGFLHPSLTVTGSLPAGLSFTDHHDGTATFAGVPAAGSGRVYPMTIVGQEAGQQVSQPFTLTVREAPAFTSAASASFTLGVAGTFQVATRGYPAPTLTRTGSLPAGLSLNLATGVLSGTPASGSLGTYKVTLRATNGVGATAQQTLVITVAKRDSAVTATCSPDPNAPGSATTCTATVTDSSPGSRSTPTASVTWGIVAGSGKLAGSSCKTVSATRVCTVTFTAATSQTADQRLRASYPGDASHGSSSLDVTSRLVVTVADTYATPRNVTLAVGAPGVLANDRNVGGGAASYLAGPVHGTLTLRSDGSFTYVPAHGYRGKDGFIYRVKVGSIWSLPTAVTITVN